MSIGLVRRGLLPHGGLRLTNRRPVVHGVTTFPAGWATFHGYSSTVAVRTAAAVSIEEDVSIRSEGKEGCGAPHYHLVAAEAPSLVATDVRSHAALVAARATACASPSEMLQHVTELVALNPPIAEGPPTPQTPLLHALPPSQLAHLVERMAAVGLHHDPAVKAVAWRLVQWPLSRAAADEDVDAQGRRRWPPVAAKDATHYAVVAAATAKIMRVVAAEGTMTRDARFMAAALGRCAEVVSSLPAMGVADVLLCLKSFDRLVFSYHDAADVALDGMTPSPSADHLGGAPPAGANVARGIDSDPIVDATFHARETEREHVNLIDVVADACELRLLDLCSAAEAHARRTHFLGRSNDYNGEHHPARDAKKAPLPDSSAVLADDGFPSSETVPSLVDATSRQGASSRFTVLGPAFEACVRSLAFLGVHRVELIHALARQIELARYVQASQLVSVLTLSAQLTQRSTDALGSDTAVADLPSDPARLERLDAVSYPWEQPSTAVVRAAPPFAAPLIAAAAKKLRFIPRRELALCLLDLRRAFEANADALMSAAPALWDVVRCMPLSREQKLAVAGRLDTVASTLPQGKFHVLPATRPKPIFEPRRGVPTQPPLEFRRVQSWKDRKQSNRRVKEMPRLVKKMLPLP